MSKNGSNNKHSHLRDFNKTKEELFGGQSKNNNLSTSISHNNLWTGGTRFSNLKTEKEIYKEYSNLFKEFVEIIDPRVFKSIFNIKDADICRTCKLQVYAQDNKTEYAVDVNTYYNANVPNPNYEYEMMRYKQTVHTDDDDWPKKYFVKSILFTDGDFNKLINGFNRKPDDCQSYINLDINLGQYEGGKFHKWHYTECGEIVNRLGLTIFNDGSVYLNGMHSTTFPLKYCSYEQIQYVLAEAAKVYNSKNIYDPNIKSCTADLDFGCYTPGSKRVRIVNIK